MASRSRKRKKKQKALLVVAVLLLIIIIAALTVMTTFMKKYTPSKEISDYATYYGLERDEDAFITYNNTILDENAVVSGGEVYIPYDIVHSYLNTRFYWDETERVLRYVLPEGVLNVNGETNQYTIGKESLQADYTILYVFDGKMYLSLSFIEKYTNMRSAYYESPNHVVLSDQMGEVEYVQLKQSTQVRELGGIKSPILAEEEKGSLVTILEEMESWDLVCTEDGFVGYVTKKSLGDKLTVLYDYDSIVMEYPKIKADHTINMAWHQVTNQTANGLVSSVVSSTKGINVLSPTWFYLNDNNGGIVSLASYDYVSYCHQKGIEVWGLISNLENPDVDTTKVLNTTSSRDTLVNNLIAEAIKYDLDGINIDIEQLAGEAGVGYLEFIRELSLKCDVNDIVLSVDNYAPAAYNEFYTMNEQAEFADYIILMAYDEHYNGSSEGSVASLGFVNQAVTDSLEKVPADQLILGVPFYTRLWKVTPDETAESGYSVTSETLGMEEAARRVAESGASYQWLEDMGQYYTQYDSEGSTYKLWLEDQTSIQKKLDVMKSNALAGASFWKLGYEDDKIWTTIADYMQ